MTKEKIRITIKESKKGNLVVVMEHESSNGFIVEKFDNKVIAPYLNNLLEIKNKEIKEIERAIKQSERFQNITDVSYFIEEKTGYLVDKKC